MASLPPLSLYIHFPWCIKKCPYCDFNSHVSPQGGIDFQAYTLALKNDLQQDLGFVQDRKLQSIFFGGGTPSLMPPEMLHEILACVQQQVGMEDSVEITLEVNPGTTEYASFSDYRKTGINRLSFGVQSFNDEMLHKLGRIHCAEESITAVHKAKDAGFENINLDLMFALPGQTLAQALLDLEQAIALEPSHISWYQLTIEPNTAFYSEPPELPDDDNQYSMMEAGHRLLAEHDYQRYEVSAFARSDSYCRHNLNYWQFGDYLGLGAGAHGKLSTMADGTQLQVTRRQKTRMPKDYVASVEPCSKSEVITGQSLTAEFAMNALRLIDGVPRDYYTQRTGQDWQRVRRTVDQLVARGLLAGGHSRLAPSARGMQLLNELLLDFLP